MQMIVDNAPACMDDRLTLNVFLSDHVQYRTYGNTTNLASAYYVPDEDRAYAVTSINDVPDEFKDKLHQYDSATTGSTLLYPTNETLHDVSTGLVVTLPKIEFSGDQLTVDWDYGTYDSISIYSHDNTTFSHEYTEYGPHSIKVSNNVSAIQIEIGSSQLTSIESYRPNSSLDFIVPDYYSMHTMKSMTMYDVKELLESWNFIWSYELTSISFPNLEQMAAGLFYSDYNLKEFYAPKLKCINDNATMKSTSIEQLYLPQLSAIKGPNNFQTCTQLTSVNLPEIVECANLQFAFCINLKDVNMPKLSALTAQTFRSCICLKHIRLPSIQSIGQRAFYNCINFEWLDLTDHDSVPSLAVDAFVGCPSTYKVLVKKDMENAFKTAANWSQIASHIKGI